MTYHPDPLPRHSTGRSLLDDPRVQREMQQSAAREHERLKYASDDEQPSYERYEIARGRPPDRVREPERPYGTKQAPPVHPHVAVIMQHYGYALAPAVEGGPWPMFARNPTHRFTHPSDGSTIYVGADHWACVSKHGTQSGGELNDLPEHIKVNHAPVPPGMRRAGWGEG